MGCVGIKNIDTVNALNKPETLSANRNIPKYVCKHNNNKKHYISELCFGCNITKNHLHETKQICSGPFNIKVDITKCLHGYKFVHQMVKKNFCMGGFYKIEFNFVSPIRRQSKSNDTLHQSKCPHGKINSHYFFLLEKIDCYPYNTKNVEVYS
jgi:hypothetical protein